MGSKPADRYHSPLSETIIKSILREFWWRPAPLKTKLDVYEVRELTLSLPQQLSDVRLELNESKKTNAIIQKKLDGLNSFVKRIGGSTDFMLKGSTSFFRKENHTLKTKVSHTNKNVS